MYGQRVLHHNKPSGWAGTGSNRLPSLSAFRRFGGGGGWDLDLPVDLEKVAQVGFCCLFIIWS